MASSVSSVAASSTAASDISLVGCDDDDDETIQSAKCDSVYVSWFSRLLAAAAGRSGPAHEHSSSSRAATTALLMDIESIRNFLRRSCRVPDREFTLSQPVISIYLSPGTVLCLPTADTTTSWGL
jgi:hypothetical protein